MEERETARCWPVAVLEAAVVVVRVGLVGWRAARAEEDLSSGLGTLWKRESL